MKNFSEADAMLLEKEITRLSYKDIAFLLDKTIEDVIDFVKEWLQGKSIIPYQFVVDEKKAARPRKQKKERKEKKESLIISRRIEKEQKVKRDRYGQEIFKTKIVDYSKMQEVRIDNKTCIYIKLGADPLKEKEKYLERLKDCHSRFDGNKTVHEVKKFKPAS